MFQPEVWQTLEKDQLVSPIIDFWGYHYRNKFDLGPLFKFWGMTNSGAVNGLHIWEFWIVSATNVYLDCVLPLMSVMTTGVSWVITKYPPTLVFLIQFPQNMHHM